MTRPRSSPRIPSGLLTPDPDVRARLTRFGLRRIGAVAELAGRRSSPGSARRARGSTPGPAARSSSRSGRAGPRSGSSWPCPSSPPVEDLEPLRFVLHRLAAALTAQLDGARAGGRAGAAPLDLDLAFALAGTPGELDVEQRFPEPTADAEAIERLLFARLERTPPPAAGRAARAGAAPAPSRRPVSSSRCSCRRPRGPPGSAGSSPGWP